MQAFIGALVMAMVPSLLPALTGDADAIMALL